MPSKLNSLVLAILAGIALVIAGILGATSHAVPAQLWTIIYVLVGGTAGVTLPQVVTTSSSTTTTPAATTTTIVTPPAP